MRNFLKILTSLSLLAFLFSLYVYPVKAVIRDGDLDNSFNVNPITNSVGGLSIYDMKEMPDGKILVGGEFAMISGTACNNFARLTANGLYDPGFNVGTGPNNKVENIFLLPDGKIYISGDFTQYNGTPRSRVARINPDGTLDTGFSPDFGAGVGNIAAIQPDGKIIVTGTFTTVNGTSRNRLARLNSDGSPDTGFVVGDGLPSGTQVYKGLVQSDGKILLSGRINGYAGATFRGIVRINTDGSRDTAFNSDLFGDSVDLYNFIQRADGKIYVCGYFTGDYRVRRLNSDGTIDAGFNTDNFTGAPIWAITEMPDGKVLIGGDFGSYRVNGALFINYYLFRFNADGTADTSFTVQAGNTFSDGSVRVIQPQTDGKLLLGGDFPFLNGESHFGLGRISGNTVDNSFLGFLGKFTIPNVVLTAPDGKIYLGGNFDRIGLGGRPYLVRLNSDGSLDNTFTVSSQVDHPVYSLALRSDGKIMVGGIVGDGFSGDLGRGIWRLNSDGSLDKSFNAQLSTFALVRTVVVQADGKTLIGGSFTHVNDVARTKIARLNSDGSVDNTFNPNFGTLNINKIVLDAAGKILVGGDFTSVNGVTVKGIIRLNSDGSTDTGFDVGAGTNNPVNAIYVDTFGNVFLGGNFTNYRGTSVSNVVKIKSDGTIDTGFKKPRIANGTITSIIPLPNNKLLVAGNNSSGIDASPRRKIFRLFSDGSMDFSFNAGSITQDGNGSLNTYVYGLSLQPDGTILALGNFNAVNEIVHWGLVRLKNNQRIPLPAFDYEGDGRSDITVFRPSTGVWYRLNSYLGQLRINPFGLDGDKPVPADFDGDFRTDLGIFRPSTGTWYIFNSADDSYSIFSFGIEEDLPTAGDFDGDGKADVAVFRPSTGVWYILGSQLGLQVVQFGSTGDKPVAADYDGDGKTDIAVFRPSTGAWYQIRSNDGSIFATIFGSNGDIPVQGDYDGDFKADIGVFRPSNGVWYLFTSSLGLQGAQFGANGDIPAAADYDGDGKFDLAVYRSGVWYQLFSSGGVNIVSFGLANDIPQTYLP